MSLPKGVIDLQQAYQSGAGSFVTIIGVVVDIMEPIQTKSQLMFTFKLLDPQLRDSLWGSQGLSVRFFKESKQSLPQVRSTGDVVLLRHVKMWEQGRQPMAISNYSTEVTVFPAESIPDPDFKIAYEGTRRLTTLGVPLDTKKLTLHEQEYVIQLKHHMRDALSSLPPLPSYTSTDPSHEANGGNAVGTALPTNVPTAPAAMKNRLTDAANIQNGPVATEKRPGDDLTAPTAQKKPRANKKFKLVKDLSHLQFADLCVEVVRKFPKQNGECELYVTDYSENRSMYYYSPPEDAADHERDGDKFNYTTGGPKKTWPGPYGWLVLLVIAKPPHADYANQEVSEGELVWLRNVNAKQNIRLEGEMWPDHLNREKVQISKVADVNNESVEQLLARKEKYWNKRRQKFPEPREGEQARKPTTKSERKKQRKLERSKQHAARPEAKLASKKFRMEIPAIETLKSDSNPHVRCSFDDVPISSVRDVLDPTNAMHTARTPDGTEYTVPFMNVKYRARVRVVDFYPKQLEHFAYLTAPDDDDTMSDTPPPLIGAGNHEWAFSLQLEDALTRHRAPSATDKSNRIWVNVHHREAQFLFNNGVDDPGDLRQDTQLLARLREKLCILWGNLEELQTGDDMQLSNRSFECCIAEYGVPVQEDEAHGDREANAFGFQRLYSMFGVTIL